MESPLVKSPPKCLHCWQFMPPANDGCKPIREDLPSFAVPYGKEQWFILGMSSDNCTDCGTKVGGLHHHGCNFAECINCHGSLYECACELSDYGADLS